jgi:hypothetical protein
MSTTTLERPPTEERIGPWERDLSTERGERATVKTTVGEYLKMLGLWDPVRRVAIWNPDTLRMDIQRAAIKIERNAIKLTMVRDLMRGGLLPPTCLVEHTDVEEMLKRAVIDGLQRAHCKTISLMKLLDIEAGAELDDMGAQLVENIREMGQKPLSVDKFLVLPFEYQLWRNLTPGEEVRLFMLLNAGQQKVTPRHLLEIMLHPLQRLFASWGVPLITERDRKVMGRRKKTDPVIEGQTVYSYERLLAGLAAYLDQDPHMRTKQLVETALDDTKWGAGIEARMMKVGDETLRDDLTWVFLQLNNAVKSVYATVPSWTYAIMQADTFVYPLLAALGRARELQPAAQVDERRSTLLALLQNGGEDPLALTGEDNPRSLDAIMGGITSNIGRRRRVIVFEAFNRFFENGPARRGYPLDWDLARRY